LESSAHIFTSGRAYRFLIGEHYPVEQVGIRQALAVHYPHAEFGTAASGPAVLQAAADHAWDLLILGLSLPQRSGLDILPELRHAYPELPVLVLTFFGEDQMGLSSLKAGAAGYLTKEGDLALLPDAVDKLLSGGKYVSAHLAERIAMSIDTASPRLPHETLSNREFQIVCLLANGLSAGAIAVQLSLNANTIGTFRRHILRKLHLRTTSEIICYAISHGLVE
jgi:two-component system, NarL family, invasion response regulator UvrY